MADNQMELPHKLTLNERRQLSMTGVSEVVNFDETTVVLRTQLGILVVSGQELQLKTLSPQGGQVEVEGDIAALHYEQARSAGGWLHRLLR